MMLNKNHSLVLLLWLFTLVGTGCTGVNSFGIAARPGDTVALALGWQQELTRQDIKVTITDQSGTPFVLADTDIRAIFNSYPDPVSNLIVGSETGQPQIGGSTSGIANGLILSSVTNYDKDYMQTFLVVDIPTLADGITPGMATVNITDQTDNPIPNPSIQQANILPINIEILSDTAFENNPGTSNAFYTQEGVAILSGYLKAMERSPHYTVTLDSATVPHAVQLAFQHNPDKDTDPAGMGRAYVVNPRSDKTINWFDDGNNLNVIIMPARQLSLTEMKDFKFYVAGGITGLELSTAAAQPVQAFAIDGTPSPDAVTVSISP